MMNIMVRVDEAINEWDENSMYNLVRMSFSNMGYTVPDNDEEIEAFLERNCKYVPLDYYCQQNNLDILKELKSRNIDLKDVIWE